jgi:hypothetical protein
MSRKNGHDVEKNIAQELKSILSPDKVVHFLKNMFMQEKNVHKVKNNCT